MNKQMADNKNLRELYQTILKLRSVDECKKFFRDLCTISEITAMAERLEVAKMVEKGISYREISKEVGASTATVTRVAHWLHHGEGGYRLALMRLK